jgi:hypothetical protein
MADPYAKDDQADPKLAAHYARKSQPPSPFYERVAAEERRIEKTGEKRETVCVICGQPTIIDSIAFALAKLCTEHLIEKGQAPLTPREVGFTCSVDCHAEKMRRAKAMRDGRAKVSTRHYTEEPDDAV